MKTKAVRLYGKNDLRLEEFILPDLKADEILAHIISNSICMSSYKASIQGKDHKRVPDNINEKPVIIGHEFSGEIVKVGKKWQDKFKAGEKFIIQPALNYKGSLAAPGYSFEYIGGNATYIIIPNEVMEMNCLLKNNSDAFFKGSLTEPMSCVIGAFHASYHTEPGIYKHNMGISEDGNMIIIAGAGPMGLGAIDYAIHNSIKPGSLVVTDIDEKRLDKAKALYPKEETEKNGVEIKYINTKGIKNVKDYLISLTGGKKYDDVFIFAPVKELIELGDKIINRHGCLNFFAGPTDPEFTAPINFYNIHYSSTHIAGTSGGNTDDMIEALEMMNKNLINPATMITHVGGLDSVINTTLNLPKIPGGKKLIYTNIKLELTALEDFNIKGRKIPLFKALDQIISKNNGLWTKEAENYLIKNAEKI